MTLIDTDHLFSVGSESFTANSVLRKVTVYILSLA